MDHVAIDLGAKKSQICVRGADGRILEERRWPTSDLESFLASRPTSRVIVETCAEAFCVADAARKLGHETRVVPATLVKTLGVGALRQVSSSSPAGSIPVGAHPQDRVTGSEDDVWHARGAGRCSNEDHQQRPWVAAKPWPSDRARRSSFLQTAGRGRLARTAPELRRATVAGARCPHHADLRGERRTRELGRGRRDLCAPDDRPRRRTADGTSVRRSDRRRDALRSAHQVESYLGLVPGESSSSERQQRLSITKAGP